MKQLYYASITSALALGFLLLAGPVAHAQTPAWQSALAVGTASGSTSDLITAATDGSGNVFVAGDFNGTITLGSSSFTSGGVQSTFLAKWSPTTSTWLWALPVTHTGESFVSKLAVVGSVVYLTGFFSNTVAIGSQTLSSAGATDLYVAKLTDNGTSGTVNWAQRAGGTGLDLCRSLAVQGGNVYVAGQSTSPVATFGSTSVNATVNGTAYLAKLTDAGSTSSWTWAQAVGNPTSASVFNGLTVQGSSVYAVGVFGGNLTYGSSQLSTTSSPSDFDALVIKLTDQGSSPAPVWARQIGGSGVEFGTSVTSVGNAVYVGGIFTSPTLSAGPSTLPNQGGADVFVAKLLDAGTTNSVAWAQGAGGAGGENVYALAVQGSSVYVGGDFSSLAAVFGTTTLTTQGSTDAFVARLVDAGSSASFAWATRAGSPTGSSSTYALVLRGTQVLAAGTTQGTAQFGSQSISAATTNTYGFLASLTDGVGLAAAAPTASNAVALLYPNPAHGRVRVVLPTGAGVVTLTLLDALGRVVGTQVATPAAGALEVPLDLSGVGPGVYALRVAAGPTATTSRLVVE